MKYLLKLIIIALTTTLLMSIKLGTISGWCNDNQGSVSALAATFAILAAAISIYYVRHQIAKNSEGVQKQLNEMALARQNMEAIAHFVTIKSSSMELSMYHEEYDDFRISINICAEITNLSSDKIAHNHFVQMRLFNSMNPIKQTIKGTSTFSESTKSMLTTNESLQINCQMFFSTDMFTLREITKSALESSQNNHMLKVSFFYKSITNECQIQTLNYNFLLPFEDSSNIFTGDYFNRNMLRQKLQLTLQ